MSLLLIAYEVTDSTARTHLRDNVKDLGEWRELSESCYIVETEKSPKEAKALLVPLPYPEGTFRYFIFPVTDPVEVFGADEINRWIQVRLWKARSP